MNLKQLLDWELNYLNHRLNDIVQPENLKNDKKTRQIIDWWYFRGRKSAVLDLIDTAENIGLLESGDKK